VTDQSADNLHYATRVLGKLYRQVCLSSAGRSHSDGEPATVCLIRLRQQQGRSGASLRLDADLGEVVPQVVDVVGGDESEGRGRVGIDATDLVLCALGDLGDDVREVLVIGRPELDKLAPGACVVVLDLDPVLLSVPGR
jgi:hypothetical protein